MFTGVESYRNMPERDQFENWKRLRDSGLWDISLDRLFRVNGTWWYLWNMRAYQSAIKYDQQHVIKAMNAEREAAIKFGAGVIDVEYIVDTRQFA